MFSLKDIRPVWAEINLDNLAHNIKEVKRIVNDRTFISAVVKADGYGHGSIMASKVFLENGANGLSVSTLAEAIELRKAQITAPILILGYTPEYQAEELINYDIIQTVYSYNQATAISESAVKCGGIGKVHIKIDTGMSRLGYMSTENSINEIIKISKLPKLKIQGMFTHFALADEEDKEFTKSQYEKFEWIIKELRKKGIDIPIKHASNSAAIIDLDEYNLDMVRAGILLYGLYPSRNVNRLKINLKPAMTLKATISNIKTVPKDTGVSYGHLFTTQRETKIGTLPIGYADGYTRMLTNKAYVAIKERKVPIIGAICMDQCMVDLTEIDDVQIGDEVILFGDGTNNSPHIDEIANKLNTINYEIICMISKRVPRVYIKNNKIVHIKNYI